MVLIYIFCVVLLPIQGQLFHTFGGYMDEFRIWEGVRSVEDIRAYMHTRPPTNDTSLLVYYDFDQPIVESTDGMFVVWPCVFVNHGVLCSAF